MKLPILSGLAIASLLIVSCGDTSKEHATEEGTTTESHADLVEENYTANTEKSVVAWKGEVAGVYGHNGVVNLKSGMLSLKGENIVGGNFVVDMTNIVPLDSASYKDEDHSRITDLQGHLATTDFFNTAAFPTSKFEITSVEGNVVKGNLTVRDKTHEETITVESLTKADNMVTVNGTLVFNRQKYDVAWVHFMKDMVLSDDITINISLVASK